MGLFSKDIATLDDLYVHQLQDIYYAEKQITEGAAQDDREGDQPGADGTASRRTCARPRGRSSGSSRSSGCTGGSPGRRPARRSTASSRRPTRSSGDIADTEVLDAALIAAAQAVEHYEITRYGTADRLGPAARPCRMRVDSSRRRSPRRRRPMDLRALAGRLHPDGAGRRSANWSMPAATSPRPRSTAPINGTQKPESFPKWRGRNAGRLRLCAEGVALQHQPPRAGRGGRPPSTKFLTQGHHRARGQARPDPRQFTADEDLRCGGLRGIPEAAAEEARRDALRHAARGAP